MKHYIVIAKWQADLEQGIEIVDMKHTAEQAKEVFDTRKESEAKFADEHGFQVYADEELNFDAGLPGHYADGHIHLYVQEVNTIDDGHIERMMKDTENFIVEVCPHCDREVYMRWSIEEDGYVAHCPYCGETMLLCDECFHRDGNEGDGPCDFDGERCSCYRYPEGRILNSRKDELFDNMIAHLKELAGGSEILNTLHCIGFTDREINELVEMEDEE